MNKPLSKIWWLWLPLLLLAAQVALELTLPPRTLAIMLSENGPHEFAQALLIAAAFMVAVVTLLPLPVRRRPWLAAWFALAALCCLYVLGEEISWGQHLFGWATPEFWHEVNDQQETNLHNTSSWLDQKPRLVLEIGVIAGGLLIPFLRRFRPSLLPPRFAVIYPPSCLWLVAAIVLGVKLVDTLGDLAGVRTFERASEVIEIYLFYFVLLYLVQLRSKILVQPASA